MTVQARPSVLVPVGLVVAQGVLFGALGAGLYLTGQWTLSRRARADARA